MSNQRAAKEVLYSLVARVAEAAANPRRLELLDLLVQAPRSVEQLAQAAHMSVANTSQHLQRLKRAGLVVGERQGTSITYRIASPAVARLWVELRAVAEQQLAEMDRAIAAYRPRRGDFEQIAPEELVTRLHNGDVVLLDARPRVEYDAGHLPGAISMPVDELSQRVDDLPAQAFFVTYCRGPLCVYADQALEILQAHGRQGMRLEEGTTEWQLLGFQLEAGRGDGATTI
jgi:rhodanese-related sulfurtransferase/biotin operon repressor